MKSHQCSVNCVIILVFISQAPHWAKTILHWRQTFSSIGSRRLKKSRATTIAAPIFSGRCQAVLTAGPLAIGAPPTRAAAASEPRGVMSLSEKALCLGTLGRLCWAVRAPAAFPIIISAMEWRAVRRLRIITMWVRILDFFLEKILLKLVKVSFNG